MPCLDGEFVVLNPALRHPGLERPVAYLGGQEIRAVAARLAGRLDSAADRAIVDGSDPPFESGLAIAGWMLNRGILVSQAFRSREGGR